MTWNFDICQQQIANPAVSMSLFVPSLVVLQLCTLPFSAIQNILGLSATDLAINQSDFCAFFGSKNCPPTASAGPVLPELLVNVDSWSKMVPTFDLRATDVLPTTVTCHGILAAGTAAWALGVSDLQSWSGSQLLNCIDVLGSIDWPLQTKADVLKLIISKVVRRVMTFMAVSLFLSSQRRSSIRDLL